MSINVAKEICEYMNTQLGARSFTLLEVKLIRESIRTECKLRKKENLIINSKTTEGKNLINKRIADIVNKVLYKSNIKPEDVQLFKKCRLIEYSKRTGKCAYGFADVRKRYGYNAITGLEEGD